MHNACERLPLLVQVSQGGELGLFTNADGQEMHPEAPGTPVDIQGELLILAVGNGRQAGGGVRLCPKAGEHLKLAGLQQALLPGNPVKA